MPVQKLPLKVNKSLAISNTSSWLIEDIVGGPKIQLVNGKKKKFYKVRWSESFEQESNIPATLIKDFESRGKRNVTILGPVIEQTENVKNMTNFNDTNNSLDPGCGSIAQPLKLQRAKFAIEISGEISILSYKQVRSSYKNELLSYYEERAQINASD